MQLFAASACLPDGWRGDVLLEIDPHGRFERITAGVTCPDRAERAAGPVVPGMPNVHSHAFQRAMAGHAEHRGGAEDDFWSWRTVMYDFVRRVTAEQLGAIAEQLYIEMLRAGYTSVGEFHYVHHDVGGQRFADPGETSHRLIEAACASGIAITHLPVFYAHAGFGAKPPAAGQARFVEDPSHFARLLQALCERFRSTPGVRIGIAPHSLRAVAPAELDEVLGAMRELDPDAPVQSDGLPPPGGGEPDRAEGPVTQRRDRNWARASASAGRGPGRAESTFRPASDQPWMAGPGIVEAAMCRQGWQVRISPWHQCERGVKQRNVW